MFAAHVQIAPTAKPIAMAISIWARPVGSVGSPALAGSTQSPMAVAVLIRHVTRETPPIRFAVKGGYHCSDVCRLVD
jgi:hypothetical protein